MRIVQPIVAGIVGALTGFASSFAIVLAGLVAVGATPAQAASGLLILCVLQAFLAITLSWRTRLPISFAWSTPGAALLVSAQGATDSFAPAIGAFLLCGALVVLTGLWPALGRLITRIPPPITGAMLAGILFPLCLAPVNAALALPALAIPLVLVWLAVQRFSPRWAVPAALVVALVGMAVTSPASVLATASAPGLTLVLPEWDPLVLVSLGLPLYVVTMAGQNLPGFAVLSTLGYDRLPVRGVLVGSGAATMLAAPFGGHALNLAALSAAIMAGPDASPEKNRRWIAAVSGGVVYLFLGLAAGAAAALVGENPPVLLEAVAGLALLGAFITGLVSAFEDTSARLPAAATFLVVASGVTIGGIGSAFWGLVVGGVLLVWLRRRPPAPALSMTPK